MTGTLLYRCRKCGALINDTGVPDVRTVLISLVRGFKVPFKGISVGDKDIHECSPGVYGVADLVGGVEDE